MSVANGLAGRRPGKTEIRTLPTTTALHGEALADACVQDPRDRAVRRARFPLSRGVGLVRRSRRFLPAGAPGASLAAVS